MKVKHFFFLTYKLMGLYKYKKAYQILMEYWDYLPEDGIREEVDKRLKEVKL